MSDVYSLKNLENMLSTNQLMEGKRDNYIVLLSQITILHKIVSFVFFF